ncbi:hypothetical protein JYU34_013885 [Plutella xylostella]|uniref:Retropepsins domain-containing protein n=1 Tax=Plutella xylostella TaxID=51655 RepID=A0ABQ7QAX8_PLUXY|nr:hypothetical protein JYU34_013885 [Plutella xylostella]
MAPKRGRARRCNLDDDDDRSRTGETTVMTRPGAPSVPAARAPTASTTVHGPPATPDAPYEHAARSPLAARATPAAAAATLDAPACVTAAQLSVLLDTIAKAAETNRVLSERMSSDPRTCTPPARRGPGAASPPARATASDYQTPPPGTFAKCTVRFDGAGRSADQLDAFIDAVQVYKECANVSDEHALRGLPMLLEGDAAVWWRGVRASPAAPARHVRHSTPGLQSVPRDIFETKERGTVESTPGNPPLSPGHAVNSQRGEHEFLSAEFQGKYDPRPLVNIKVGGALGAAVLDTGATHSIASNMLYGIMCNKGVKFEETSHTVYLADGSRQLKRTLVGATQVSIGGRSFQVSFLVFPESNTRTALGRDAIITAGIVLNLAHGVWAFGRPVSLRAWAALAPAWRLPLRVGKSSRLPQAEDDTRAREL